jgi:K+-transporting ATPase ATPase C chain
MKDYPIFRESVLALRASALTLVVCAVAYPACVWGMAHLLFPSQASGSLIYGADGRLVIGSELVAQRFASDRYFHPRPSFVEYNAAAAGGSNMATSNPELRKAVVERLDREKATPERPAPVDLVTASGSGLDPDISPESADYQAARVAAARGLPIAKVRALVDAHTNRSLALLGAPPRVNVLELNLALDKEQGDSQRIAVE